MLITMIVKDWIRGPWWDDSGMKHDGPVTSKTLPDQRRGIVGVVDCVAGSSVGQGFSSRGIPLYICYPIRSDYPPCIVAVKEIHKRPLIVRLDYEYWDGKWPRAGITSVLGYIGDTSVEKKAIQLSIAIQRTSIINIKVPDLLKGGYNTQPWDRVIHIDPVGCTDVDDICCWRNVDGVLEFCVAIADVSAFVVEGSPTDKDAALKGATLYDDGVVVDPMLPTVISSSVASLRADKTVRPAIGIVYSIRDDIVIGAKWRKITVAVNTSYTYESVVGTSDANVVESVATLIAGRNLDGDSHLWIEALMIDYNRRAAEILQSSGYGLLRTHSGIKNEEMERLATKTGCQELAFLGASSGLYEPAGKGGGHAGLGLAVYTHASSPLRRYADLVNQRWLKHILFADTRPSGDVSVDHLNMRNRLLKQTERLLWLSSCIQQQSITEVSGIVLKSDEKGTKVYCPKLRRTLRGVSVVAFNVGDSVSCRIFCDLKQCSIVARYVVQVGIR